MTGRLTAALCALAGHRTRPTRHTVAAVAPLRACPCGKRLETRDPRARQLAYVFPGLFSIETPDGPRSITVR